MLRAPRHPAVWFSASLGWFGLLWFFSSLEGSPQEPPPFPHFDKVAHFGYFLAGGFLLAGGWFRCHAKRQSWAGLVLTISLGIAAIGLIDEWHQCFTPGRSGGDPWDWLADLLGGTTGAFLLKLIHRKLE